MPALNKLYRQYNNRVAFFMVYIQEAHPIDAWQLDDNINDDVLVATARTAEERNEVAGLCVTKLSIEWPALVDEPDNRVERAYTAWPDRMYVVARDGTIAYKSAAGPFGFKPAEVESALQQVLGSGFRVPGSNQGSGFPSSEPRTLNPEPTLNQEPGTKNPEPTTRNPEP